MQQSVIAQAANGRLGTSPAGSEKAIIGWQAGMSGRVSHKVSSHREVAMPVLLVRLAKKSSQLSDDGGDESLFEHKAVASALDALDRIAKELSVASLSQFISENPDNVYDLVDDEDEAASLMSKLAPVQWYDPDDVMPTIEKLIVTLTNNSDVPGVKSAASVIADLRDLEAILKYCMTRKARFRFYQEF